MVSFNRLQTDILRRLSPGRDITHNFMGFYTEFDHFTVAKDLDFASWDSYPLGFLEQFWAPADEKHRYLRQGHPDVAAFHHDLYRGCGRGRWWVMEQQPGPVNWARYNPAPLPGMVRAWTWEAFAHGAEVVSYFRWRQAPFAQEQMHAGLNRPDNVEAEGAGEARQVAGEIVAMGELAPCRRADVALAFSYEADWHLRIQPQGRGFSWIQLAFEAYGALRRQGLDVDIVAPDSDFSGYKLVVCPSLPILAPETLARLEASGAVVLFGPRTGSRTPEGHIPPSLPPGVLQHYVPFKVKRVESLRPDSGPHVILVDRSLPARLWREEIETTLPPLVRFADGAPAWLHHGVWHYLATWPGAAFWDVVIGRVADQAGLTLTPMPEGVRTRTRDGVTFAINFAPEHRDSARAGGGGVLLGWSGTEPRGGVSAWRKG